MEEEVGVGRGYVDAFKAIGAKLWNPQCSFSARCEDGSIAISCWSDFFVPRTQHGLTDVLRYRDTLSRVAHNPSGARELEEYVREAIGRSTPFRLVIGRPGDAGALTAGRSASSGSNRFTPRPELVGSLVSFDGNEYVVDFRKRA
jgi:hypothetical protein